jgi:hypothetical protein
MEPATAVVPAESMKKNEGFLLAAFEFPIWLAAVFCYSSSEFSSIFFRDPQISSA